MTAPIVIMLSGRPVAKERPRAFLIKGTNKIGHYTPKKTKSWEGMFRLVAMSAMEGRPILEGPVQIVVKAIFAVPASWPAWKKELALAGKIAHTATPDGDNITKAAKDALNGVVYRDDALACRTGCIKVFGPQEMVVATVTPLDIFPSNITKRPHQDNRQMALA